jgi:hypothetical protein
MIIIGLYVFSGLKAAGEYKVIDIPRGYPTFYFERMNFNLERNNNTFEKPYCAHGVLEDKAAKLVKDLKDHAGLKKNPGVCKDASDAELSAATGGLLASCTHVYLEGGCTHSMYGPMVKANCCASCTHPAKGRRLNDPDSEDGDGDQAHDEETEMLAHHLINTTVLKHSNDYSYYLPSYKSQKGADGKPKVGWEKDPVAKVDILSPRCRDPIPGTPEYPKGKCYKTRDNWYWNDDKIKCKQLNFAELTQKSSEEAFIFTYLKDTLSTVMDCDYLDSFGNESCMAHQVHSSLFTHYNTLKSCMALGAVQHTVYTILIHYHALGTVQHTVYTILIHYHALGTGGPRP